jgi:drug/metabolite transporter (DMT)-like permease
VFPVIAVLVSLTAAALFAVSNVIEQRSTKQVPERGALSPRLLVDLARQRRWLAAIAVQIAGNVLQVVALHFGELALVQPLLVFNLLFTVVIAVLARHRPPDRIILAGVICCAAGVACFLGVARPHAGHGTVSASAAVPLAAALGAVLASCLVAARWGPRQVRALWLAAGCGADFGVTAFLLKLVPDTLPQGFSDPVRQWPLYLVVITGPVGFLLNQSAFQAGVLISPVLAIITTLDPLVSIGIARVWLDESFAGTPTDLAIEALSLAAMTGGIVALAHRAPHIARELAADHAEPSPPGARGTARAGEPRPVRKNKIFLFRTDGGARARHTSRAEGGQVRVVGVEVGGDVGASAPARPHEGDREHRGQRRHDQVAAREHDQASPVQVGHQARGRSARPGVGREQLARRQHQDHADHGVHRHRAEQQQVPAERRQPPPDRLGAHDRQEVQVADQEVQGVLGVVNGGILQHQVHQRGQVRGGDHRRVQADGDRRMRERGDRP